ncbi:peptidase [Wenzhouxiangella sp. XN79A]|uniref:M14 family zinc carboxypeptidase n=1 Tax=Wenzhouxiangella sp. XN79A TaxID=2724193 RepID=UPI00144A6FF3|nr:M14 family zinc carboxypeptidase [Wenzhouxiangella sp. XN79A]NKI33827.1 peptidase [Wenzhouxiangella sp. XN79A]
MRALLFVLTLLAALPSSNARSEPAMPDIDFRSGYAAAPGAPSLETLLGVPIGSAISEPGELARAFERLVEAYPDRTRKVSYATSWQGRDLFYVIIGTPDRIEQLDAIRDDILAVARPDRHDDARIETALERLPGTVWLSNSVHGNEIAPADAALMVAHHLLTADSDPVVDTILAETLVFIDPMQNPDGRARFVQRFEAELGLEPLADRLAAEHDEPWPSGRVNHYLFDLNRDWLAITQPETEGRVAALLEWFPLAFVDAHEMGPDTTFFFAPEAVPYNPLLVEDQRASLERFGRNNARWFDALGLPYFTREIFDAFYPGYGASWPSYYGAVAMTYEQASVRGLKMRRRDATEWRYVESVERYAVALLATAETVARNRQRLWRDFAAYRASAVEQARQQGTRAWVIPTQRDQRGADRLASLLARHGADVHVLDAARSACDRQLEPGSYVIPAAQPAYRKLRVLLDDDIALPDDFAEEQERLRALDRPDEIYDVTAWSLPAMFNLEVATCRRAIAVDDARVVRPGALPAGRITGPDDAVVFLVAGGSQATGEFLAAALGEGLFVQSNEKPFEHAGRTWPSGSVILPAAALPADGRTALAALAARTGATVVGVGDTWVTDGPNLGSMTVRRLHPPRVALAWDAPTDIYAPGALRFVLERRFGVPVTPIRTATLRSAPLDRYDVVILPDDSGRWGGYETVLGTAGRDHLADWVEDGGVLITLAGATDWAADADVDLLAIRAERQLRDPVDEETTAENDEHRQPAALVPGTELTSIQEFEAAVTPDVERPDSVAGVLVRAEVDTEHWLAAGLAPTLNVLVRGDRVFGPITRDRGRNVVRFAGPDRLRAAGYLWDENRRQLAYKPFVVDQPLGRGRIVAFTEDPSVRAYLDGLNLLVLNAVLRAPSYTGRVR